MPGPATAVFFRQQIMAVKLGNALLVCHLDQNLGCAKRGDDIDRRHAIHALGYPVPIAEHEYDRPDSANRVHKAGVAVTQSRVRI